MTFFLTFLSLCFLGAAIFALIKNQRLEKDMARLQQDTQAAIGEAQQESERRRQYYESETQRVYGEAQTAVAEAQKQLDQQFAELKQESEQTRQHYEAEARKSQENAEALLAKTLKELEPLRKFEHLQNAEDETKQRLAAALAELADLQKETQALIDQQKSVATDEIAAARDKAKDINAQADARLNQALKDAGRIVAESERRAEQILPAYLDARLAELKWGAALYELNRQWQEEQRSRREELRAAQRDAEEILRKQREAARETELKKTAIQEAEQRHNQEIADLKEKHEKELAEAGRSGIAAIDDILKRHSSEVTKLNADWQQQLDEKQKELEEATKRELTAAQLGKLGCVYVISNMGSFNYGEESPSIFKIGMTRRPDPNDRIGELSNASVPFAFDIHALIRSENAPALETRLHHEFRDYQVNKNNFRKEFFRVSLPEIRQVVERLKQEGLSFEMRGDWIEKANAEDFYLSRKIENDPLQMETWRKIQERRANRIAREALGRVSAADLDDIADSTQIEL